MATLIVLVQLLLVLGTQNVVIATNFPQCWIKQGECLDHNEGPLEVGVSPQNNINVVAVEKNVDTFDQCVTKCTENNDCRFFTYYKHPIELEDRMTNQKNCHLVGFNLQEPCFLMKDTCVLLKECLFFDANCTTCQTGARPLLDPKDEPLTVVLNGVDDNRDWKSQSKLPYDEERGRLNELIMDDGTTCLLSNTDMTPRFGSVAGFAGGKLINCGGFTSLPDPDPANPDPYGFYLKNCQKYDKATKKWISTTGNLTNERAYASSVVVPKTSDNTEVLYVMGGYFQTDTGSGGFLDSVERFDATAETWSPVTAMKLREQKSHFCLVMASPNKDGDRYLYAIGGWNIDYLNSVDRMKIGADGSGSSWEDFPQKLKEGRADLACAEVQIDATRKGIMAAGGYKVDGAWLASVEFLDYEKGEWVPLVFFPRLHEGRHYHGITTINMIPTVFGGWNNGTLSSMEYLDSCSGQLTWKKSTLSLRRPREKFAVARIPKDFVTNCN